MINSYLPTLTTLVTSNKFAVFTLAVAYSILIFIVEGGRFSS